MKRIVFTGGGSAGHVTPNIALFPKLRSMGYDIHYIGSYEGIEKKLIEDYRIPYYGISTGKLRRYFDIKNFSDPFRVLKGFVEARKILKTLKPDIVFSKGGFVSVPVVRAAALQKIPCIIHESDMTPTICASLSCRRSAAISRRRCRTCLPIKRSSQALRYGMSSQRAIRKRGLQCVVLTPQNL